MTYDVKCKNTYLEQMLSCPKSCGMMWQCISILVHLFVKVVPLMEWLIINLADICNEKGSCCF